MQFTTNFSFNAEKDHGSLFFTLGKGEGKNYQKVYKSENHVYRKQKYIFDMVLTNTDSLADSNEDTLVTVAMYKYNSNGNHKKLTES